MDVSREKNTSFAAIKDEGVRSGGRAGAFGDLEIARNCELKSLQSQSLTFLPISKNNFIHWNENRVVETRRKRKVEVNVMDHEHVHYDLNKMWKTTAVRASSSRAT